jgi:hypothetical protein
MIPNDATTELLQTVSRVLFAAFLLGMGLLVVWFGAFMLFRDFIYGIHSRLFAISRAHFDAIHYAGMAFTKIMLFVGFLFPLLGIRWVLRGRDA